MFTVQQREIPNLKGNFFPEEIADLLEVPIEFVNEAITELQEEKEENRSSFVEKVFYRVL